ncbi:uncharacterized protein LOC128271239 [Anopheles cruzii]|uniref:uncharacterized protein LOC128271239 n=1 Tax=Anopheles cruzii TaxID=68878 RepID=UPI0022EC81C4|nr:uncharacterized protein LOC128271239 [Anopheles cruzii]
MAKLRSIFKKHLIPNLESKCRLCLSDKAIVHSIFQSDSSKEATDTLVEKIFECTAIMLSKDYDYPSPICEDCALKLDEFLLFRAKCLRSNEIYRFNRLHKQRFLFGSGRQNQPAATDPKSPVDVADGTKEQDTSAPAVVEERCAEDSEIVVRHTVPLATICEASGSSSSDSRTVIETEQRQEGGMLGTAPSTDRNEITDRVNGDSKDHPATVAKDEPEDRRLDHGRKPPDTGGSNCSSRLSPVPPIVLVNDETDTNTTSEEVDTIPLSETRALPTDDDEPQNCLEGIRFPVETVEQLDRLERLVRTCDFARERYIILLRQLKTPHTSLSETYQQLFADRLLIHYNYDGISPKYNKRSLKTLALFTDCMAAAWEDHMDVGKVKEAVIEAVRKSHNRYNQYNHRKLRMVIAVDPAPGARGSTVIQTATNEPGRTQARWLVNC